MMVVAVSNSVPTTAHCHCRHKRFDFRYQRSRSMLLWLWLVMLIIVDDNGLLDDCYGEFVTVSYCCCFLSKWRVAFVLGFT